MDWIKDHWNFMLGVFAIGGLWQRDQDKEKRLARLEDVMMKDIPTMNETLARIDERTKKL